MGDMATFHAERLTGQEKPMLVPINGYEGVYSITKDGMVWSHSRTVTKTRLGGKPFICAIGGKWLQWNKSTSYYQVVFNNNGIRYMPMVHKLIAEAYIPNPLGLPEVNHIDGNKVNNSITNLEWVTRSGNQKHAWNTGLQKNTEARAKHGFSLNRRFSHLKRALTAEKAREALNMIHSGDTVSKVARTFCVSRHVIHDIAHGLSYKEVCHEQ